MLQEEQLLTTKHDTKTILVVEDDADNLWLYTEALALLTSYHVKAVRNGSFALDFVQHIKPDLFILDYRLPNMNGIQLYDQLHATPGLEHIPAIIISSITSEE